MLPYRILGWHPTGHVEFSAGFRLNLLGDERHSTNEVSFMSHHIRTNCLLRNRLQAFKKQRGHCYYCDAPMWLEKLSEFAAKYRIRKKQAERFQCTAEHLIARKNGGTNARENIVAACWYCNSRRHRRQADLSPAEYWKVVMCFMERRTWHPKVFHHML